MGNASSSIKTSQTNEITIDKKVPKHLQPIKKSKTRSNSRIPFISNGKPAEPVTIPRKSPLPAAVQQQQQLTKHNKTLIPHTYTHQNHNINHYKENGAIIDQSASTPQLFLWKRGRRFQNAEVMEVLIQYSLFFYS